MRYLTAALAAVMLTGCAAAPPPVATKAFNHVMASMTYATDMETHGISNKVVPCGVEGRGDCEDFSLCFAQRLNAYGATNHRQVLCQLPSGQWHQFTAFNEVWALDNRHKRVMPLVQALAECKPRYATPPLIIPKQQLTKT